MQKGLLIALALICNLCIQWYGHTGGKIAEKGVFLGLQYDSNLIASTLFTLKWTWLLILINIAFAYAAKLGIASFGSFISFIILWLAMAPLATILYTLLISKESLTLWHGIGMILVLAGGILVNLAKEL